MIRLSDVLTGVGDALFQEAPNWIWHDRTERAHASVPFRRHRLRDDHDAQLDATRLHFRDEIQEIEFFEDHLNLVFQPAILRRWIETWASDAAIFHQEVAFPDQGAIPVIELPSGWGQWLRSAEALARIPGWDAVGLDDCKGCGNLGEVLLVLLRQAEILRSGKGDKRQRQLSAIEAMILQVRRLWMLPILHPAEMAASAYRQSVLKLLVEFARRAGARWEEQ